MTDWIYCRFMVATLPSVFGTGDAALPEAPVIGVFFTSFTVETCRSGVCTARK